jgi:hydroxymethylpyrimidine pyrophosphatase-like HAD family hydrolase
MKMNPKNVVAINKARENGHLVFINTGRSTGIIYDELMHGLFDGVVASIGGEVYLGCPPAMGNDTKTLFRSIIPKEEIMRFAEEFLLENRTFVMEATSDSPFPSVKNTDKNPLCLIESCGSFFTKPYVEGKPTEKQIEYIKEKYQLFIHPWYFEFTTKGCNKATGMEMVLSHFGIPKENCIAIGDSINDLDMLAASGNPVCVSNAVDALKEICVYQTCHAKDGALFDCFKHFELF